MPDARVTFTDLEDGITAETVGVTVSLFAGTGVVQTVVAGTNVTVDSTDPAHPVVSSTGGGGGGAVASVNGHTGTVVLAASDVGADASGAAAAAQTAAVAAADSYTDGKIAAEVTRANAAFDALGAAAAAQAAAIAASQPLDSDLTAIAALTTTAFGRSLLTSADAAALRTAAALGTAATSASTDFDAAGAAAAAQAASQPLDSDLTAIAALATTSFGRSFLTLADAAAGRTLLGLGTAATTNTGTGATNTILGNDARLTDARTPTAHATTHESGGTDAIRLDQLAAPTAAVALNAQKITGLANGSVSTDGAAFGQIPTAGTGASNYAAGNDSRLSDSRTPTAHHTTHESGGGDAVSLDASQITSGVLAIGRLATGTPDGTKFVRDDGTLATPAGGGAAVPTAYLAPTGASYETFARNTPASATLTPVSGRLSLHAIALPAGFTIGHIAFCSIGAAGTPTHWWFGLYDSSRVQLALTADQTTTAWGGSTQVSLPVATIASGASSTFTTTYSGLHYIGFMMTATTPSTLAAAGLLNVANNLTPVITGGSDNAQTTPPAFPHTAATPSSSNSLAYAWVGV